MAEPETAPTSMSLDELLVFREITERISAYLQKRLKEHLAALSPLLSPGRVLGKHVGTREAAPRADEALAEMAEKYKQACTTIAELKPDLDEEVMAAIGASIQLYPYEYNYEAHGEKGARKITMTSPVRWVVTYGTATPLSQIRALLLTSADRRSPSVRQFVVNALAFQTVLGRSAGTSLLIRDLRYEVRTEMLPGLEGIPLVNFSVHVPSFRPADELLLTATRLSGVPAFIEVIDSDAVGSLVDPLRTQVEGLLDQPAAL